MERTDFMGSSQKYNQIRTPTCPLQKTPLISQLEKFALEWERVQINSGCADQRWLCVRRDSKTLAIKSVDCKAVLKMLDCLSRLVRTKMNQGLKKMIAQKNRKKGLIRYFMQLVIIHGKRKAVDKFYCHMVQTNKKKALALSMDKIFLSKLRSGFRKIEKVNSKLHNLGKIMAQRLKKGAEKMNITLQFILKSRLSFESFKRNAEPRTEDEQIELRRNSAARKQIPRQFDMRLFLQIAKLSQFLNRKVLETYRKAWANLESKLKENVLLISLRALNDDLLKSSQKVNSRGLLCSNMTLMPWKSEDFVSDYEGSDHETNKENDSSNSISG